MDRRHMITGGVIATVTLLMGVWWFSVYDPYIETYSNEVVIARTIHPVTRWRGIATKHAPEKMQACFVIEDEIRAPPAIEPLPPEAPGWFKCFSAEHIARNLANDYAEAFIAERNDPEGYDRMIAIFPGGRAFMWRQPNGSIAQ